MEKNAEAKPKDAGLLVMLLLLVLGTLVMAWVADQGPRPEQPISTVEAKPLGLK